jgi:hypothetical protein
MSPPPQRQKEKGKGKNQDKAREYCPFAFCLLTFYLRYAPSGAATAGFDLP